MGVKIPSSLMRVIAFVRRKKSDATKAAIVVRVEERAKDRARAWVHAYAAGGAAYALVPIPIPGSTTAGLVALEATMVHAIARIYGVEMNAKDAAAIATGLEVTGGALKTVAREATVFVPGIGWLIRSGIAALAIEAIGTTVIGIFERRTGGRLVSTVSASSLTQPG